MGDILDWLKSRADDAHDGKNFQLAAVEVEKLRVGLSTVHEEMKEAARTLRFDLAMGKIAELSKEMVALKKEMIREQGEQHADAVKFRDAVSRNE